MASDAQRQDSGGTMSTVRTIGGLILVVILIAFTLANLDDVTIDFLLFTVETKMLVAMLISALLGAAVALMFSGQGLIFGIGRRKSRQQ